MSRPKEILVRAGNGLYIMEKLSGAFGLTTKEFATLFPSVKKVKAAIKFCRQFCYRGEYIYIK